jgi:DNA-directed RNA polymerase specialized sigma24 family protein
MSRLRESEQALAAQRTEQSDEYGRLELRDQLIVLLDALPIRMRTIIVLRYFHDMRDGEIAETLGITPNSVRSQLSRGLARLRTAVAQADAADADSDDGTRPEAAACVSALLPPARLPLGGAQ